jgi:hypothetical protein
LFWRAAATVEVAKPVVVAEIVLEVMTELPTMPSLVK